LLIAAVNGGDGVLIPFLELMDPEIIPTNKRIYLIQPLSILLKKHNNNYTTR